MAQCDANNLIAQACESGFTCRNEPELLALLNQLLCNYAAEGGGGGVAYVAYRALITQGANSAPTVVVIENGLSGPITWTRSGQGIYTGTLVGAFTQFKTFLLAGQSNAPGIVNFERASDDTVVIQTFDITGALTDSLMLDTSIEVLVYP